VKFIYNVASGEGSVYVCAESELSLRIVDNHPVLTLGRTVGMCGVAIAVIDQSFWRPLEVHNGGRLLSVYNARPAAPQYQTLWNPDYVTVREAVANRLDLAAYVRVFQTLADGEWPTRVQGELASDNYFTVLSASPLVGRFFGGGDGYTISVELIKLVSERRASFAAKDSRDIRSGCPTQRHECCECGCAHEQPDGADDAHGIERLDFEKYPPQQARRNHCGPHADEDAHRGEPTCLRGDHPAHRRRRRTECHTDGDLSSALADRCREDRIQAGR
jgi:hypothetical protein